MPRLRADPFAKWCYEEYKPNTDTACNPLATMVKTRQNTVSSRSIKFPAEIKMACIHLCRWKRHSETYYELILELGSS